MRRLAIEFKLRNQREIDEARCLVNVFLNFSVCSHREVYLYSICASEPPNVSQLVAGSTSSAARLGRAIGDATLINFLSALRMLARCVSNVLYFSVLFVQNYMNRVSSLILSYPLTE